MHVLQGLLVKRMLEAQEAAYRARDAKQAAAAARAADGTAQEAGADDDADEDDGMRQEDLMRWYMEDQQARCARDCGLRAVRTVGLQRCAGRGSRSCACRVCAGAPSSWRRTPSGRWSCSSRSSTTSSRRTRCERPLRVRWVCRAGASNLSLNGHNCCRLCSLAGTGRGVPPGPRGGREQHRLPGAHAERARAHAARQLQPGRVMGVLLLLLA